MDKFIPKNKLNIMLSAIFISVIYALCEETFGSYKLEDVFQLIHKRSGEMQANNYTETFSPTEQWTRHWLLQREAALKSAEHKKLLLFCHMRGGSTFFGDFFYQNSEVMYWYEPIAALYVALYGQKQWTLPLDLFFHKESRRRYFTLRTPLPDWELSAIDEYNHNLLGCDFNHLPAELFLHPSSPIPICIARGERLAKKKSDYCDLEALTDQVSSNCRGNITIAIENNCGNQIRDAHKYIKDGNFENRPASSDIFLNYSKCRNYHMESVIKPCFRLLTKKCSKSKLVVYKGLRLTMESVDAMLQRTPDMHVIYFIRDPRSIVTSRTTEGNYMTFSGSKQTRVLEARYLCEKMLNDYKIYKQLDKKYPGAIKFIKYEDLVKDRYSAVKDVYGYLDMEIHESVYEWIEDNLSVKRNGGRQSTRRRNSTASLDKWRGVNRVRIQQSMTEQCEQLLTTLGYQTNI